MKLATVTHALHKNQSLNLNTTKLILSDDNKNVSSKETNKTFEATSKPIEVVIKKPNSLKIPRNLTNVGVLGMRSGSEINSVTTNEKRRDKRERGRRKRETKKRSYGRYFGNYDYPSSKEIPGIKSSEVIAPGLLDFGSFEDFIRPIPPPYIGRRKDSARSFMSSKFFSSEDFINSPITDSRFFSEERSGDASSDERNSSTTSDEDYTDEKDAYDIHGFRSANIQDRSAGPKPPAYGLAQREHDFTPSRLNSGKPVVFPQRKVPTVSTFKTNVIHRFPGFALPGSSTEDDNDSVRKGHLNRINADLNEINMNDLNGMKVNNIHDLKLNNLDMNDIKMNHIKMNNMINDIEMNRVKPNTNPMTNTETNEENDASKSEDSGEDDDSEEHHHHHFYDQLRHVHINPPKGFDPDSFRLTLPNYIKRGKYSGKKHKHFHHIENAPVIIKYDDPSTPKPGDKPASRKPKSHKKKKKSTDRPLTESEEEAMYDEEGEISEKEIENAYKNYDDSGITKDIVHDYEIESEESGEESKVKEIKKPMSGPSESRQWKDRHEEDVNRIIHNVSRALNSNFKSRNPKSFSNFWKWEYLKK